MVASAPEITLAALSVSAAAKLNLNLSVLGVRGDGFHELNSLVMAVGLCDTLVATDTADGAISIQCDDSFLASSDNLVIRAARLLQREYAVSHGVAFELTKTIPVGGGMGGGSSDAACALRLCDELWSLGLSQEQLARHAGVLGSDVPLFFSLPSALITGRGECVEPVRLSWSGWAVLATAETIVSTPDVYRAWSESSTRSDREAQQSVLFQTNCADGIMELTYNDLEPAVLETAPEVQFAFDAIKRLNIGAFRVSGAGSTMFRLYDEEEAARHAASIIEAEISSLTTRVVTAPVGAEPIRTKE